MSQALKDMVRPLDLPSLPDIPPTPTGADSPVTPKNLLDEEEEEEYPTPGSCVL